MPGDHSTLCRRELLLHAVLQELEGPGQDLFERVLCSFRLLPFVQAHDPDLLGLLILFQDPEAEPRGLVVAGLALRMNLNAIEGPLNGLLVFWRGPVLLQGLLELLGQVLNVLVQLIAEPKQGSSLIFCDPGCSSGSSGRGWLSRSPRVML